MKRLFGFLALAVLVAVVATWDFSPPVVQWTAPQALGRSFEVTLDIADEGKGIRRVRVWIQQAGREYPVHSQENALETLPWQSAPRHEQVILSADELESLGLAEGPLELAVEVLDQPNLWFFPHRVVEVKKLDYDRTPPQLELLSTQHYLRQGGSEAVLYRISEPEVQSGVMVGDRAFRGYPIPTGSEGAHLCLFALAYDQPADAPVRVWVEDRAGNRKDVPFWCKTFSQDFRSRDIDVTDQLIEAVTQDILANTTEIDKKSTPIDTFVEINSGYREMTNERILDITSSSADRPLWDEAFLQLTNSQVESRFADQRVYFYQGQEVDRQTHLGFDLASTAQSAVEASNAGTVVFADYLGIYGNTVILDHGLGLFSLYGHLSSASVEKGQSVSRGDVLGKTGRTGLAAGDHLHYSMLVGGVQVNPLEWWDPKWVQDHVLSKLKP